MYLKDFNIIMEVRFEKRLFKPTITSQTAIKTQLEVCKHIISSQIVKKLTPTLKQRNKLHDRLLQLQWKFIHLESQHLKLIKISKEVKAEATLKQQKQEHIKKLQKQILLLFNNSKCINKKLFDREQLIQRDTQYLQKIISDKQQLESKLENTKSQVEKIHHKISKLNFIARQLLRQQSNNSVIFEKVIEQKQNFKLKLYQKGCQLKKQIKSIEQKNANKRKEIADAQLKIQRAADRVYNIQADQQLYLYKLTIQNRELAKLQRNLVEQRNKNMQLKQKLKIHKQRQQKLQIKNEKLNKCAQIAVKAMTKMHESSIETFEQTRKFQQSNLLEIQHCTKIYQATQTMIDNIIGF